MFCSLWEKVVTGKSCFLVYVFTFRESLITCRYISPEEINMVDICGSPGCGHVMSLRWIDVASQQTQDIYDAGPALNQHWAHILCLLAPGKCAGVGYFRESLNDVNQQIYISPLHLHQSCLNSRRKSHGRVKMHFTHTATNDMSTHSCYIVGAPSTKLSHHHTDAEWTSLAVRWQSWHHVSCTVSHRIC